MSAVMKTAAPTNVEALLEHCRANRRGTPAGDIRDVKVMQAVLTKLLEQHLERTAPQGKPSVVVDTMNGYKTHPAEPAPEWTPDMADPTARALAHLIAHLQDRE